MGAEVVNLRQHRKRKARTQAESNASENRARFGRTKAEKQHEKMENDRVERLFEQGRRSKDGAYD